MVNGGFVLQLLIILEGIEKICIIPEIMLDEKAANLVQIILTSLWSLGFRQAKLL
jgi:hypothetical protein